MSGGPANPAPTGAFLPGKLLIASVYGERREKERSLGAMRWEDLCSWALCEGFVTPAVCFSFVIDYLGAVCSARTCLKG